MPMLPGSSQGCDPGVGCELLEVPVKAISLFSGVGGFELGFGRAGIETVLQAERDPWALKVLARHWPKTERVTDVRDVGEATPRERLRGRGDVGGDGNHPNAELIRCGGHARDGVDLVYGGFPCQDISVAGKRAGLSGERSGLWFEFARVIGDLRPTWVCVENVAGLLSSGSPPGADLGVILGTLVELGYGVAWRTLDARYFGVPQRRRRVFIVASLRGVTAASAVLAVTEGGGGDSAQGEASGENTSVAAPLGAHESGGAGVAHTLKVNTGHAMGEDLETYIDVAYALNARDAKGPLPDRSLGNTVIQSGVRRLTPLECERLMGWPDEHTRWTADGKEIADSHRYRMCGNGVVAPVAEWIGHRLMRVEELLS